MAFPSPAAIALSVLIAAAAVISLVTRPPESGLDTLTFIIFALGLMILPLAVSASRRGGKAPR